MTISLGGLELLASAVLILDADGCITYANAAAENLFEVSARTLLGQKLADLFTIPRRSMPTSCRRAPTSSPTSGRT